MSEPLKLTPFQIDYLSDAMQSLMVGLNVDAMLTIVVHEGHHAEVYFAGQNQAGHDEADKIATRIVNELQHPAAKKNRAASSEN